VPRAEATFKTALEIFEAQAGEVTQFWFAAATMNEVAKRNEDTLRALNLTPSFWITARVAMEYQAILTAAKIFGPRKTNPHNIDWLFQIVREPARLCSRRKHSNQGSAKVPRMPTSGLATT
jgi:hypothetical protein